MMCGVGDCVLGICGKLVEKEAIQLAVVRFFFFFFCCILLFLIIDFLDCSYQKIIATWYWKAWTVEHSGFYILSNLGCRYLFVN